MSNLTFIREMKINKLTMRYHFHVSDWQRPKVWWPSSQGDYTETHTVDTSKLVQSQLEGNLIKSIKNYSYTYSSTKF